MADVTYQVFQQLVTRLSKLLSGTASLYPCLELPHRRDVISVAIDFQPVSQYFFKVTSLKAKMPPILTDVPIGWSVCMSVTLVHPAKVVGRNESHLAGTLAWS